MRLKDIGTIVTVNTPSKKNNEYYESNDILFIKPSDIEENYITSLENSEEYISEKAREKARILPEGAVLVTCIGTIGKVGILKKEATCNQQINAIIPNDKVISKYLAYLMQSKQKLLQLKANAPVVPIINKTDFSEMEINICDIDEQKKIVEQLDLLKTIIDKRKKQIEELQNILKSQFVEMFGDPVLNEKQWKKTHLGDECNIITGNTPSRNKKEYYGDFIEWIKSDNINTPSNYITQAEEYLSEEGEKVGRTINANSILMTCIAGSISCIGNVAMTDRKVAFNQQINGIETLKNNVNFMYIQFLLSKEYIQSTINMSLKGILSKGKLSELEFIFPPIELQNQFADMVKQIDKQKFESVIQSKKEMEKIQKNIYYKWGK